VWENINKKIKKKEMAERERERMYEINMVWPYRPIANGSLMGIYSRLPRD